ncbi:linear amide C-N hydrolase [Ruegeria atlantica]|uniref:linear amide C-N hydrolase n=1 Tax=Ruegeria atlantica TaxID=81569 RepID=UPI002494AB12|nr:linear amide C-N hydrolase [Ruegeria atlantica]
MYDQKRIPEMCAKTLVATTLTVVLAASSAIACSRIVYETADGSFLTGRTLDWFEDTSTDIWAFPQGMDRDGGAGENSIEWTSKYGSVVATIYDGATVDGMNDGGLVGNALYLAEADYGTENAGDKPLLSVGGWLQYFLDNFATVEEAVAAMEQEPFVIVAPMLPSGHEAGGHIALSDASGDSAIFEYLDGELVIHHGREFTVMTNSPTFDEQLAITTYWGEVNGLSFLPGTHRSSDRFARLSWNLNAVPSFEDKNDATAAVFSLVRSISVPFGVTDPERPNIASTTWRTVADHELGRYYYESVFSPTLFWVDIENLDLSDGASTLKLELGEKPILAGEVSASFEPSEPFLFLGDT